MKEFERIPSETIGEQIKRTADFLRHGQVEFNGDLLLENLSRNDWATMLNRVLSQPADIKSKITKDVIGHHGTVNYEGLDLGSDEVVIREVLDKQDEVGRHFGFANGIQTVINILDLSKEQIDRLRSVYGVTIESNELYDEDDKNTQEDKWVVSHT